MSSLWKSFAQGKICSILYPQAAYVSDFLHVTLGLIYSRSGRGGGLGGRGLSFGFLAMSEISVVDIDLSIWM
jgi:hypothetical protein